MHASAFKQRVRRMLPRPVVQAIDAVLNPPPRPLAQRSRYLAYAAGRKGLEIGGPSSVFRRVLPIYEVVAELDGANFAPETVWEGRISAGRTFSYAEGRKGFQYIADATDLSPIRSGSYDLVLSSNCLEHVANPLKALMEWKRVLLPDGALILVVPNKASNFDHRRETTRFEHILDDFHNHTSEHDQTHLEDILERHDLALDPPAGSASNLRRRSLDNFNNRTLHHHVFDTDVMKAMLAYVGFEVVRTDSTHHDFLALATCRAGAP
ncbi:MAG: methyltransferase domain-containing protein [Rubrivivax sp.]|nr:methyltransferase domain-containing protein [Rubrivivax sp.]